MLFERVSATVNPPHNSAAGDLAHVVTGGRPTEKPGFMDGQALRLEPVPDHLNTAPTASAQFPAEVPVPISTFGGTQFEQ